jgi:predicted lipoprotein
MNAQHAPRTSHRLARKLVWPIVFAIVAVAMIANTKVLTFDEAAAVNPAAFDAAVYASDEYPGVVDTVTADAVDLAEVAADPTAAGEAFGNAAGTDKFAIPVTATGVVTAVDANFITLAVDGLPEGSDVRVAIGQGINGTALRDVTGTVRFADFANQTDYQQVANEFKILTTTEVVADVDTAALNGQTVTVVGIVVTNSGPDGTFIVTPVSITGGVS